MHMVILLSIFGLPIPTNVLHTVHMYKQNNFINGTIIMFIKQ